jgi:phosphatidylinositol-3-phosphatase
VTRTRGLIAAVVLGLVAVALLLVATRPGTSPSASTAAGSIGPTATPVRSSTAPPGAATAPAMPPTSPSGPSPSASTPTSPRPTTGVQGTGVPEFRHVYLIVMENKGYGSIVGSNAAPYLNSLIRRYGLATRYDAVAHPSEPNYIALFSGGTQGVRDDGIHDLTAKNLADQLEQHGRTWRVFAQNVPLGCYKGAVASGGPDGNGTYVRKHEPAISFTSIARNPGRCRNVANFSHFDPAAADFELIVPNMCNDMHDCSVAVGDDFLRRFVPRITRSAAFADSVLFITWDEGTGGSGGGGRVATIVVSPLVAAGYTSNVPHTHYSLLRTIEASWGLGCLRHSCAANDMREFFGS